MSHNIVMSLAVSLGWRCHWKLPHYMLQLLKKMYNHSSQYPFWLGIHGRLLPAPICYTFDCSGPCTAYKNIQQLNHILWDAKQRWKIPCSPFATHSLISHCSFICYILSNPFKWMLYMPSYKPFLKDWFDLIKTCKFSMVFIHPFLNNANQFIVCVNRLEWFLV